MAGNTIAINSSGFTGYLTIPASGNGHGLILIPEIFGINSHIRDTADLYASAGYTVLAPDLFWRVQPGVQLGYTPEDMTKGIAIASKMNGKEAVADLAEAGTKLRSQPSAQGKIGAVGYCMGGSYAYLMAAKQLVDVAVCYYGGYIASQLNEAKQISCPIMLHFGEHDKHIPLSDVQKIKEALPKTKQVELYIYDADHGFNCDQRASYDRRSAMLAYGRTQVLLSKVLA